MCSDEIRDYRGNRNEPGRDSPYRNRSIEDNLRLFRGMKERQFPDGHCVLRAKIDMTSGNMNMRDPLLYRIKSDRSHPITGDQWCIYPMYDFGHAISDALEGITHSLCTLEFENHRPLYDWVVDQLLPSGLLPYQKEGWRPQQIEFSRLNVQYTVLSKRKLIELVRGKHVSGWDDPRMPTVCGLRRRGYPHTALKLFCDRVGVTKTDSNVDLTILEDCVREVLEHEAPRLFAVLRPLKVTLTNWNEVNPSDGQPVEQITVDNHPKRLELGQRVMPFTRTLYVERDDFFDTGVDGKISPPVGYKRLLLRGQVRLRFGYIITCNEVVRDSHGGVIELRCTLDPRSKGGILPEGSQKVKGVIPWVSEQYGVHATVLLYDRLFSVPLPGTEGDFLTELNPHSLDTVTTAVVEPSVVDKAQSGQTFQFERQGYFTVDPSSSSERLLFNRVVTLRDTWTSQLAVAAASSKASDSNNTVEGIEDYYKVDLRVGQIQSVVRHPSADSLYVATVDCGDASGPRSIVSGLVKFFTSELLLNKKVVIVSNLKSAKIRGVVSEGMILTGCVRSNDVEKVELVNVPEGAVIGEAIRVSGVESRTTSNKSKSSFEVWKRVSAKLSTNSDRQLYFGTDSSLLSTSAGPCFVSSVTGATIE